MDGNRYYFFMKKTLFKHKQWWRLPHGSVRGMQHWLRAMMLLVTMTLMPQGAWALLGSDMDGTGFWWRYFIRNLQYTPDNKSPYVTFSMGYAYDYLGYREGYQSSGMTIYVSKDGGSTWQTLVKIKADKETVSGIRKANYSEKFTGVSEDGGVYKYGTGELGTTYHQDFKWVLPLQWRNCNLKFKGDGQWVDGSGKDRHINNHNGEGVVGVGHVREVTSTYTFTLRDIQWNGDYTITPDGTVTVPYKFTGSGNTDGDTRIWTNISGKWMSVIKAKELGTNFNSGTYSFNLYDVTLNGKKLDFRTDFNIEPYHEFRHDNDKDAGNGKKYYDKFAGEKKVHKLPIATNVNVAYDQDQDKVTLTWQPDNSNYSVGDWGTKWAIYRNGEYLTSVLQERTNNSNYDAGSDIYTFVDEDFPHVDKLKYQIYYIWKDWDEKTARVPELKSEEKEVSTSLSVPVKDLSAKPYDDRIVFTWKSHGHAADWGHEFRIFVDNETSPIAIITPTINDQTDFVWVHRTTDQHSDRQSGVIKGEKIDTLYTEEPLNVCTPHDYRIESWAKNMKIDEAKLTKRAIGTGTLFYSADASKGVYPGIVKLNWHVNLQGSTAAKTYIIERRTAEKESEAWEIINPGMTSREERMNYIDETPLPGVYYDYRITVQDKCPDGTITTNDTIVIGFAQTTGTVSGRITFGSAGTAVAGADVILTRVGASASGDEEQYHAMRFTGTSGAISWAYPDSTYAKNKFASSDFSLQMWISPDEFNSVWFARLQGDNKGLGMSNGELWFCDGRKNYTFGLFLKKGKYNHVTLTRKGTTLTCYLMDVDGDGNPTMQKSSLQLAGDLPFDEKPALSTFTLGYFKGYVDDFRLWAKCLTEDEILENFDHLLVGNEKGLETYWTFDEGLNTQFFDSSRSGTTYHNHHGNMGNNTESDKYTPSALKLKAKTDIDGNYIINGVPFSGEGTTYAIIPQLGIHDFSPTQQLRFVSNNSLVHNSTDFTDVSSFPVSGTIYYSGTTYPVEGVTFAVDGVTCTKDGSLVTTNSHGEFEISVPIGKHFIQISKNGHVFVNEGRFPADPTGTGDAKHTFNGAITGLEFRDTTLVNFTGRVVGGDIEGNKPVGFGESTNNIGTTRLTLTAQNTSPYLNAQKDTISDTSIEYNPNTKIALVPSATDKIQSYSWRGAGIEECRNIYIETDPVTGEFSAMLPPLEYAIGDIVVKSTGAKVGGNVAVDLSNTMRESYDSLQAERYYYNTKLVQAYHSKPVFNVSQENRADGLFGVSSVTYKDAMSNDVISIIDQGNYVYGHPIFKQDDPYIFILEGYEQYENYDRSATSPVVSKVPLKNTVVTIDNALSDEQSVFLVSGEVTFEDGTTATAKEGQVYDLKSNQLQLDSLGQAKYKWKAGLPNVAKPYTRTIAMTYDINGKQYQWSGSGMTGIILGDLPTGNNFVTSGPDKLEMILRDPPGTGSSAEWSTGTVKTKTTTKNDTWSDATDIGVTWKMGLHKEFLSGSSAAGAIVCTSCHLESKDDLTTHATMENEGESGETIETTTSITKAFATSEEPDYVGAYGDVFIGQATNIVFGNARNVGFTRNGSEFELGLKDVISTSLMGGTTFAYTQGYIENYLLPNFEKIRNSMLQTTTQDSINSYSPVNGVGTHNYGKKKGNLYFTTKSPTDKDFGADGTYTVIIPKLSKEIPDSVKNDNIKFFQWCVTEKQCSTDSIRWINLQIRNWENTLALNEREKARAYELYEAKSDSVTAENYSFNGGASYSYTIEKDSTHTSSWDWNVSAGVLIGNHTGNDFDGWGIDFDLEVTATGGRHEAQDSINSYTSSFSYTLAEEGSDALTVDVYEYGAFGPIFRTRGGQTCNPYEGEVRAQYYQDKNGRYPVLMEATMQIEVPQIDVDENAVSDIPTGSAANYTLHLSNASEIGEDVTYKLFFLDETNPNGAQLMMDGKVLTAEGRLIKVPGNQTLTKMLQLKQTDTSVLNYEGTEDQDCDYYGKGIGIVFASESQPEEIADTVFIRAYFTPSSSDVNLALSNRTLNTQTGSDLTLTFSGFDRNYHNLKAFRLQYKQEGATDWTQLKEYVLNAADKTDTNETLPEKGATVDYLLPMSAWSDGNYLFRVESAATYGNDEVRRYSNEIALVKDMQKPRPMGQPEPADGVLDIGDNITIDFNEMFVKGELTKANNFTVTGVLNGAEIAHETALSVNSGSDDVASAQTEASINLSGKDFSIDAWVNIKGNGTLLSHGQGTNKLTIGTNSNDKLVVTIGDKTYTSNNSVPKNDWAFLTMNVTADGKLNASVATANETKKLFTDKDVAAYTGNGPVKVGCGSDAAMHELLLWDEAHDLTSALANRTKTKNPSTRHLIGYWKMNEGEGTSIRDYARNRNMVMPDETWYLNNENKAVTLDGKHYISINATMLPITEYDDYAVEFWMRSDEQKDEAQLLQLGDVALSLTSNGQLMLTGKGAASATTQPDSEFVIENLKVTDNAWHHIGLNVLRQGAAAVYVDGKRYLTTNATNVGSINGDKLVMGVRRTYDATVGGTDNYTYDHPFKGEIDEVRIWGATMNGDLLAKNRKVRFTGTEDGLVAYYPFETKTLDSYNQVVTIGTPKDLTGSGLTAQLSTLNSQPSTLSYVDIAPALRTKPAETNVNFNYVASDDKIVIETDEDPAVIEGCTLNFNVRNVRDVNGNYSVPAKWSAFVNKKELVWADDNLSVTQEVKDKSTVTATIVNKGGKQQMWTIGGMPAWLTASSEYGTTNPRSETSVDFTVSPNTPIGKYEETVYLKDNDGIEVPLTINVKVTGKVPDWNVNPKDYQFSMNVIGRVEIQGTPMDDEDDIIAAFIGEECRGVAHPEYKQRYDGYYVTMDIYGDDNNQNKKDTGKEVTFRFYDASTGTLYPVVEPDKAINFKPLTLVGKYNEPVVFDVKDMIEQSTDLKTGWNWLSLYVKTGDAMTVNDVFEKITDDVVAVKSQTKWVMKNANGEWSGELTNIANNQMYAVQMKSDRKLRVVGKPVNPAECQIDVQKGWNWIGYYGQQVASVSDALAGVDPEDGDILKGQSGIAYFDNYEWAGSLAIMEPGVGYMFKSIIDDERWFSYPAATVAATRGYIPVAEARRLAPAKKEASSKLSVFKPIDFREYANNAIMTVKLMGCGKPVGQTELGVFADDECRTAALSDNEGMAYLTIPGDDNVTLTFKVFIGDEVFESPKTINYEVDGIFGTPDNPIIIDLDNATLINSVQADDSQSVYDLSGRKMPNSKLRRGVYIIDGQKKSVR